MIKRIKSMRMAGELIEAKQLALAQLNDEEVALEQIGRASCRERV